MKERPPLRGQGVGQRVVEERRQPLQSAAAAKLPAFRFRLFEKKRPCRAGYHRAEQSEKEGGKALFVLLFAGQFPPEGALDEAGTGEAEPVPAPLLLHGNGPLSQVVDAEPAEIGLFQLFRPEFERQQPAEEAGELELKLTSPEKPLVASELRETGGTAPERGGDAVAFERGAEKKFRIRSERFIRLRVAVALRLEKRGGADHPVRNLLSLPGKYDDVARFDLVPLHLLQKDPVPAAEQRGHAEARDEAAGSGVGGHSARYPPACSRARN